MNILVSLFVLTFVIAISVAALAESDSRLRYQQADQRLNAVYKNLRSRVDKTGRDKLRDAQRAWIVFRDAECAWAADQMRGGARADAVKMTCLADQTAIRADDLELYLESYSP